MLRIDLQRLLELLDGEVGLVVVVVAHAEVGADVHVLRVERQRLAVPLDRVGVAAGVVVEISELRARDGVLGIAVDDRAKRLHLRLVEHRRRRRARHRPDGVDGGAAVSAAGTTPVRGDMAACWLPIIQPAIRPKNTPAIA